MPVVCVNPGHGGSDLGARGHFRLLEKDLNLDVALALLPMLRAHGIETVLSRKGDVFMSHADRAAVAEKHGADLMINIHHNGFTDQSARGIEVWHSIEKGQSKEFAEIAHKRLISLIPFPARGIKSRVGSTGKDYYGEIRLAPCPAVITETGFMTNPTEAEHMTQQEFIIDEATALSQAAVKFFNGKVHLPEAEHWADKYMEWMVRRGRLKGYPDGTMQPDNALTRAEYAVSEYRDSWESTVHAVSPAVVMVINEHSGGLGSGSHIGGGYVLTNHHVVALSDEDGYTIPLRTGVRFLDPDTPDTSRGYTQATLVYADPRYDLALMKLVMRDFATAQLPVTPLAKTETVGWAQEAAAVGHPIGLGWSFTAGVVSHMERYIDYYDKDPVKMSLIQIDTAINPGNSGGALIDKRGKLIGVPSAGFMGYNNLGLAIRLDSVMEFLGACGVEV